jgi:8-oxo-dGTP pyrophosphatase MutT (NUDIX family)
MSEGIELSQRLRLWADELHAIANEGLHWERDNPYSIRRMERIRRIAAKLFAAQGSGDAVAAERMFAEDTWHVAPYPCGDAAIFNAHGEILLIQRKDDQRWAMPGGAFEVGETPAEAACREAWEETGVEVEPLALVGVYDSRLCGTRSRAHLYQFVFLCRPCDPNARPTVSNETLDVRWYMEGDLPPLSPGHAARIAGAFRYWRGELQGAIFDWIGGD